MISKLLIWLIRWYQKNISPLSGRHCRYIPTCSQYAVEAITVHGPLKGSWMAFKRVLRCNPLGGWGFDPVPEKKTKE